jgi:hypothetical protein
MLNELRELAVSLGRAGISPPVFHPKFPNCPKKAAIWVYLDDNANILRIGSIPLDEVQKIRKWDGVGSLGTSFPAVSMPPLLISEDYNHKKILASMKKNGGVSSEDIVQLVESSKNLWSGKFEKLKKCLDLPVDDLLSRFADVPDEFSSIGILLHRAKQVDAEKFYEQLKRKLIHKIIENGDIKLIDLLFYYGQTKPSNQNDFQIVFEIDDWNHFPANHDCVQRWMNARLLEIDSQNTSAELDAFGKNASGKDDKYPKIGFKNALGNVILRSMSHENPCQYRYGMINFESFPAGKDSREEIASALEWLKDARLKGKTWSDLSYRMERAMLLFAYPSVIPENVPDLAGMLGDVDETDEDSSESFSTLAQKVTDALHGGSNDTIESDIRVFVLAKRKGDARTKVIASSRYAAAHVIRSAEQWQVGCRGIPKIEVRCFGKNKGDKPVWQKPLIPFPAEVAWCLNTVWMAGKDDNGERISRAKGGHGFTINDALCLLLGEGIELRHVANRALGTVIRNASTVMLALGHAHAVGKVHKTENKKYSKQLLLLPSIIGLLLFKLGLTKGVLMASPAFLVGRLFNIADSLHLAYCKRDPDLKKHSIPPQLVGNALMATAQEEPVKALSMLWGRIKPYHAWGQTLNDGEHVGPVGDFLKHLSEVSDQLKDLELPTRCTDADKAQMLLGYLAKLESNN